MLDLRGLDRYLRGVVILFVGWILGLAIRSIGIVLLLLILMTLFPSGTDTSLCCWLLSIRPSFALVLVTLVTSLTRVLYQSIILLSDRSLSTLYA